MFKKQIESLEKVRYFIDSTLLDCTELHHVPTLRQELVQLPLRCIQTFLLRSYRGVKPSKLLFKVFLFLSDIRQLSFDFRKQLIDKFDLLSSALHIMYCRNNT